MKTTEFTSEQKRVHALGERANEKLWEVYNKIYSDDSCDTFDEEHDNVYYQIQGFAESFSEFEEDYDVDYADEFQDALDLAIQLDNYRKALLKHQDINWIYC